MLHSRQNSRASLANTELTQVCKLEPAKLSPGLFPGEAFHISSSAIQRLLQNPYTINKEVTKFLF